MFPNYPISKLQTATYAEALLDLSPEDLEFGCAEANRTMTQFPKPGHIRDGAAKRPSAGGEYFLGPRQLDYPEVSKEEREKWIAELESDPAYQEALKKLSMPGPQIVKADPVRRRALNIVNSPGRIAQQRKELLAKATPEELDRANRLMELK